MMGTVTATSVFDFQSERQEKTTTRPILRAQHSALPSQIGEIFNPFQLFVGAMIPSAVLRNPDLSPSAKLVFARLAQFAGRQGKAWPSDQTLGREVGLGDRQVRRCVAELERYGLIRRVSRAGHSNLFEFLWHPIYEEAGRTDLSAPVSPEPPFDSKASAPVLPGQNREALMPSAPVENAAVESSHPKERRSSEQSKGTPVQTSAPPSTPVGDQNRSPVDPEQVFLYRLRQRHGTAVPASVIVQCIAGELKSWRDWEEFLVFDERQTTAPELLKNPPGYYRQLVPKFYAACTQKRDGQLRQQQLDLERQLEAQAQAKQAKPVCPLSQCNGSGKWWNEQGRVVACACEHGQKLSAKVLEAFEQLNAKLQTEAFSPLAKRPPGSELLSLSIQDIARSKTVPLGLAGAQEAACG